MVLDRNVRRLIDLEILTAFNRQRQRMNSFDANTVHFFNAAGTFGTSV